MKSSIILSVFAAIPFVMGVAVSENEITPRACVSTKCKCTGIPNGLFCGDGALNCKKGNVYQCGGDGKLSCDYGVRNGCKKCNKLSC